MDSPDLTENIEQSPAPAPKGCQTHRSSSHNPTAADRAKVSRMANMSIPQFQLAKIFDLAVKTLRRHYRKELSQAGIFANLQVIECLHKIATSSGPKHVVGLSAASPHSPPPAYRLPPTDLPIDVTFGSSLVVSGAFNPHSLHGDGVDFLVLDEVASHRPEACTDVFRPALADRKGRALFIGTPKGRNHFYDASNSPKPTPIGKRSNSPPPKVALSIPTNLPAPPVISIPKPNSLLSVTTAPITPLIAPTTSILFSSKTDPRPSAPSMRFYEFERLSILSIFNRIKSTITEKRDRAVIPLQ